jgi:hypothetical protein
VMGNFSEVWFTVEKGVTFIRQKQIA